MAEPTTTSPAAMATKRWLMPLVALLAAGLSIYLAVISMQHRGAIGCGGNLVDCDAVLSSRWSSWLGLPVAVPAAVMYVVILALVCRFGWSLSSPGRARSLLAALTLIAAAAAVWFIALQVGVIGAFCPFCTAVHLCGLALAGYAWFIMEPAPKRQRWIAGGIAGLMLAVLIAGQLAYAPPTHRLMRYTVGNRELAIDVDAEPIAGSPAAAHVLVKVFDYTCSHCRTLHHDLEKVLPLYGNRVAVVLLPMPLNRRCNPYVFGTAPVHEPACDMARLALAVWHVAPEKFLDFHHWLLAGDAAPSLGDARRKAAELLGDQPLAAALAGDAVENHLQRNVEIYGRLGGGPIPKLLIDPQTILVGPPESPAVLIDALDQTLGLTANTQ